MVRKSAEAFRTISEVAEILDIPAHVLRFWESKFSQIKPVKRGGGRRYYRPADIDFLRGLRDLLHGQGMSIKAAQALIRENGAKHVAEIGHVDLAEAAPETVIATTPARKPAKPAAKPRIEPVVSRPPLRVVPEDTPADEPLDLFAHAERRDHPDAGLAERRAEVRRIYDALKKLRQRMAG
ncbi:MerR family transcriptional regulator [Halovulum sp. GXIMD14793]